MLNAHIKHTIPDAESQTHALWMEAIISVSFPASCVFMRWGCRQHCITFIGTGTEVIRSLWMLEMTSGALDSLRRGSCHASVCSEVWLDKHKARLTWAVPNSFVIWFEWDWNSQIKLALLLKCNNFYYYLSLFSLLMGASLDCEQIKVNGKIWNPELELNPQLPVKQLLWTNRPQLCPCLSMLLNFKARQCFCANYSRERPEIDGSNPVNER